MKAHSFFTQKFNIFIVFAVFTTVTLSACTSPTEAASYSQAIVQKGVDMVLIPAGNFKMGSDANKALLKCQKYHTNCEGIYFEDEEPPHQVYLDAFYLDIYEVSNASYAECVNEGVCKPPKETGSYTREHYYDDPSYANYPVIYVNWDDANTYCTWRGARLPTEAEWEKAARGGNKSFIYPWGNEFVGTNANLCDSNCFFPESNNGYNDGYEDTAPVGSYPNGISIYGVYDMAGNVSEWISDYYFINYYTNSPKENPNGPSEGSLRIARGGSWLSPDSRARSATRNGIKPSTNVIDLGFRCSVSP